MFGLLIDVHPWTPFINQHHSLTFGEFYDSDAQTEQ